MSDDLDSLSDQELSERFAVEVAETMIRQVPCDGGIRAYSMEGTGAWREIHHEKDAGYWWDHFTSFATDANSVLPWLEKCYGEYEYAGAAHFTGTDGPAEWHVRAFCGNGTYYGKSPTFARAACIALIRAKRANK